MNKIDIHCHTTNRAVAQVVNPYYKPSDDIISHMNAYDIEYSVLLATYFPHKGTGISNYFRRRR